MRNNIALFLSFLMFSVAFAGCLGGDEASETVDLTPYTEQIDESQINQSLLDEYEEIIEALQGNTNQYRGTWGNPILSNYGDKSTIYNCEQGTGWRSIDVVATTEALISTGQNLFLFQQKGDDVDLNSCQWSNTESLLTAFDDIDQNISSMIVMEDDLNFSNYASSINNTKAMANNHSDVLGLTIDDSHQVFRRPHDLEPGTTLSNLDAKTLHEIANNNSTGPSVGFMPYIPAEAIPVLFAEQALVIGMLGCNSNCTLSNGSLSQNGDFHYYPGDEIILNSTFETPQEFDGQLTNMSFILHDELMIERPYTMDIVIEINNIEVGRYSMVEQSSAISIVNFTTPELIHGQTNTFSLQIDSNGTSITRSVDKLAYLWDFRIGPLGSSLGEIIFLENISGLTTRSSNGSGSSYSDLAMFATDNSQWKISNYVDSILFKYPLRDVHYSPSTHDRFVFAVCDQAHKLNISCMEVYWANDQWTGDVVGGQGTPSIEPYFDSTATHADGVIFWMLELNLHNRSNGDLSLRQPWDSSYQTAIGFAGGTPASPGWFHSWYVDIPADGNYFIGWYVETNLPNSTLVHHISINGERINQQDSTSANDAAAGYSINVQRGDTVVITAELIYRFSSRMYVAQFTMIGPNNSIIDLSQQHHVSGINTGSELLYFQAIEFMN